MAVQKGLMMTLSQKLDIGSVYIKSVLCTHESNGRKEGAGDENWL